MHPLRAEVDVIAAAGGRVPVQVELFLPEPGAARRIGGGPPGVQLLIARAFTEPVKLELLAVATARPDEWLEWRAFRVPMDKYQISFCMGHVLSALAREGRLQEKVVYLGTGIDADRPGAPGYRGYTCNWKAV